MIHFQCTSETSIPLSVNRFSSTWMCMLHVCVCVSNSGWRGIHVQIGIMCAFLCKCMVYVCVYHLYIQCSVCSKCVCACTCVAVMRVKHWCHNALRQIAFPTVMSSWLPHEDKCCKYLYLPSVQHTHTHTRGQMLMYAAARTTPPFSSSLSHFASVTRETCNSTYKHVKDFGTYTNSPFASAAIPTHSVLRHTIIFGSQWIIIHSFLHITPSLASFPSSLGDRPVRQRETEMMEHSSRSDDWMYKWMTCNS